MKGIMVRSTTLFNSKAACIIFIGLALLTAYYRMAWPFLLLILFLFYLGWSYFWTVLSCRYLAATDSGMKDSIFAGDTLTLEYRFVNQWIFPLARFGVRSYFPVVFKLGGSIPLDLSKAYEENAYAASANGILTSLWIQGSMQRTWLSAKEEGLLQLKVNVPVRGYYYIPPAQFYAGDPSGLYQGFNRAGQEHYLMVLPNLKGDTCLNRILSFEENHREDIFGLDDRYQTFGIRDYQPNDPPKNINWYASARTKTIKTNLYQRKVSALCLVVLDISCGFQPVIEPNDGREVDPMLEDAISFACGISLSQLELGSKVAFFTNAPMLCWEKDEKAPPGSPGVKLRRKRQITALDFAPGYEQGQRILRLCAAIDDTGRATLDEQKMLWSKIREISANATVYLLGYHKLSDKWERLKNAEAGTVITDPAGFYTSERLAELSSSRVRVINLSNEECK